MTHKNLNPVSVDSPKRVAIVISNPGVSTTTGWPVGFWWSELTHPYFMFTEAGYEVEVFSPNGGACTADAMSDPEDASQWQAEDVISRGYKHDPEFMKLIENTQSIDDLDIERFEARVVAGGQGPMFTFETATNLQRRFVEFYEARTVSGFANVEEDFADQSVWDMGLLSKDTHVMPWRIEDELKALGANFIQAGLWRGFAVRDGNLITGQQNFSGGDTAELIIESLGR